MGDGRQFYFARYIDWGLTTPLMLHSLVHFAGASDDTSIYMFFMDVLMIVAGLIASVVDGGFKWFFFAFAILTFLPVIHYICWLRSKVVDARLTTLFLLELFHHGQPPRLCLVRLPYRLDPL